MARPTIEEVRRIARLAHLEYPENEAGERLLDDATLERLATDLGRILEHVRDLEAVDIEGAPPTSHGVPLPTRTRVDEAEAPLPPERALAGAPEHDGDAFVVPKVVE